MALICFTVLDHNRFITTDYIENIYITLMLLNLLRKWSDNLFKDSYSHIVSLSYRHQIGRNGI